MTWRRALAAVVAGLAAALSIPTPGIVPLAFVAWVPLLRALDGATLAEGAALGFTAGGVFFAAVLRWLPALSPLLWIAVSLYLALYVAVFGAIAARLWRGPRTAWLALPAAWVALEWMRGWMFGGFPWAELGVALGGTPRLLSFASVGGVALLSLAIMSCNVAVAVAVSAVHRAAHGEAARAALLAAAIPVAMALHALWVTPSREASAGTATAVAVEERGLSVVLVGGDIDPRIAADDRAFGRAIQSYVAKTDRAFEAGRADLAIWPETALPHPIEEGGLAIHARALRQRIEQQWKAPLLFGVPVAADAERFWNEAQLWSTGEVAHYRKRRLVPFGEYAPETPLVGRLSKVLPGPDVAVGEGGEPFTVGNVKLGLLICFEDLFSDDVVERAAASDALVILTNDGWLGDAGAAQHALVAALRAVESGRWIARVANRGSTGIIDPWGRAASAALSSQRLPASAEQTIYAAAPFLVPLLALVATVVALAVSWKVTPSCESGNT